MGARGRKSADHLNVVRVGPERPKPPYKMSRAGKKIWKEIVDSHPPGYFRPGTRRLLSAYCEAVVTHDEACLLVQKALLIKTGTGSYKQNPAVAVKVAMAGVMGMLASKLRIAVSSYRDRDVAGAEGRERPVSTRKGLMFGEGE